MSAGITPENESFLQEIVSAGKFQDRTEAINAAIDLLKRRAELIDDINRGIDQLERGLGKDFDVEALLNAIDARVAERS